MQDRSARNTVRLRLVGGFELDGPRGVVRVSQSEQRVLAYLALHRSWLPRALVAGALWFTDESHAQTSLRSVVWKLRKGGLAPVEATKSELKLAEHVDVDVHRQVKYVRRRSAVPAASPLVDEATVLDGDLLPGWYEDWVLLERESLRQQRLHALELLGEQLRSLGRYGEAIHVAMRAMQTDPLRESPHRLLISIHESEGNFVEAARQASRYHSLLQRAGLEPSPAFLRLARSINSPDKSSRRSHDKITGTF
jgi:DNA-binding SARP family transcriptional activator